MRFKDHFSRHAEAYARSRPSYPANLFEYLAQVASTREHAWDCATGNGQAAIALAHHFAHVTATDASVEQIRAAPEAARVTFRVAPAEDSGLDTGSVDLITVAQAAHWFDLEAFHAEATRTLKPRGVIALWCYELCTVDHDVDRETLDFYNNVVGPYWPPERRMIEEGYRNIDFPYEEMACPAFPMRCTWNRDQYLDYIATWSAVKRYENEHSQDPMLAITPRIANVWPNRQETKIVEWPLKLRVGRARASK